MKPIGSYGRKLFGGVSGTAISRREILAGTVAAGALAVLGAETAAAVDGKKTFTILHTNDLHSNLIGLGPALDYTPFALNDDNTRGGFARIATLIADRKKARQDQGPVLVLDAGDYSMGTAFGAAIRETGAELQLLAQMGYDATTFGNHDFDLGPDGLAKAIDVAAKAGRIPAIVASNTDFSQQDPTLSKLQALAKAGTIRRYAVIERGGIRFGIFGLMGKESIYYTSGAGAITFPDAIEVAREMVKVLRETEKAHVVICLSHGGMEQGKDGTFTDGEDVRLAKAVPGIDIVIGGHTHTELKEAVLVNGRTPVVQTGKYGQNLGELVIGLEGGKQTVEFYRLHPIDDTISGDKTIAADIERFKPTVDAALFAARGFSVDQPLAIVSSDLPNSYNDIAASTPLSNLITDAFRNATGADIGFSVNGTARAGLSRGKSGVQTVYDVFAVAPLGAGIVDPTAGSSLVTGWFTATELKNILEFFLVDNPAHPGEFFPRASGMRFHYNKTRPAFDVVTSIEVGDFDHGYTAIDMTERNKRLYSLTCSLYVGMFLVAIPKNSKGRLLISPKKKDGQPLRSKVDALDMPRLTTPDLLPPPGQLDQASFNTVTTNGVVREIKEWQAIMDHIRGLPIKSSGELPTIPLDARAHEVRAIQIA